MSDTTPAATGTELERVLDLLNDVHREVCKLGRDDMRLALRDADALVRAYLSDHPDRAAGRDRAAEIERKAQKIADLWQTETRGLYGDLDTEMRGLIALLAAPTDPPPSPGSG